MLKNDKYSLILVAAATVLFITGLILQNTIITVSGFVLILIGAGAYRGVK